MKFECPTNELKLALNKVQNAVASKSPIATIVDGILMEVEQDSVTLTGYNGEMGIKCTVPSDVRSQGQIIVPAKMFYNIVSLIKKDTIRIELDEKDTLYLDSDGSHFEIKGRDAESFPKLPEVKKENELTIAQGDLKSLIRKIEFAISKDEQRRNMTGALLKSYDHTYEMVAVDGYRLALVKLESVVELPTLNFLIHGKTLSELKNILNDSNEAVTLYTTQNHIKFLFNNTTMISRLIQAEFLPYENLIPTVGSTTAKVKTKDFQYLIKCAMTVNMDHMRYPVNLKTEGENTLCVIENAAQTKFNDHIQADIIGDLIDIDFNAIYFKDALNVIDDEEIMILFNGKVGPCFMKPVEGDHFGYLVLPIRR